VTSTVFVRHALAALRWLVRWPNGFIVAFVALQLTLPLHYYFLRRDEHDERFAWRMFSSVRMTKCEVELRVGDEPIELRREFHDAWIALAQRGRRNVVEAMGARLCRKHPGQPVTAHLTCRPVRGAEYAVGGFDLCTIPRL
jgi:hypothetical protein